MKYRTSFPWATYLSLLIPARRGLDTPHRKEQDNVFLCAVFMLFYKDNINLAEGNLTQY